MTASTRTPLLDRVSAYPGLEPRLLIDGVEDLALYRARGGYPDVAESSLIPDVVESGLRGRGGAGFPAGVKLQTVRDAGVDSVVVANGEEGEPTSVKDRWLLRNRPHLVLDGLRLAAMATRSTRAVVYLSDESALESVARALDAVASEPYFTVGVSIVVVEPTYVAGEETAAVQAINGGPALPTDKPPRPFVEGVAGLPTLVNNVETLANMALLQQLGVARYRSTGTADAPGTFLLTLTTRTGSGLYEVPFGTTLRQVLTWTGSDPVEVRGFLMGGYFAGVLGRSALDLPLDYDAFAAAGSGLGCGAVVALDDSICPVAASSAVMTYFGRENAGQCGSCFNGTSAMANVLEALRDGRAGVADVDRLDHWSTFLRGRGACGTLDGATNIAASLLREFPGLVEDHLRGECDRCATRHFPDYPPYAVWPPTDRSEGHVQ